MSRFYEPEDLQPPAKISPEEQTQEAFDRLTKRQKNFLSLMLANPQLGDRQLMEMAGYSAKNSSSKVLRTIEGKLGTAFREIAGVTEATLVRTFTAALFADKVVAIKIKVPLEDGKGCKDDFKEEIQIVNLGPDHTLRSRIATQIAKLGGYEAPMKIDHTVDDRRGNALENHNAYLEEQRQRRIRLLEGDAAEAEYEEVAGDNAG